MNEHTHTVDTQSAYGAYTVHMHRAYVVVTQEGGEPRAYDNTRSGRRMMMAEMRADAARWQRNYDETHRWGADVR